MTAASIDEVLRPGGRPTLRRLAGTLVQAVHIVDGTARRQFRAVAAIQLGTGFLAAGQLVLATVLANRFLTGGNHPAVGQLAWPLAGLAACTGLLAVAAAIQREQQRIIGEQVARSAQGRVLRVAASTELAEFDRPEFHDRLQRAQVTAELRPIQLATGLLTFTSATVTSAGLWVGLTVISPLLGLLVAASAVPLWLVASRSNHALYRLAYVFTPEDRQRVYLSDLLVARPEAAELRAYRMGPALQARFDELFGRRVDAMRQLARARLTARLWAGLAHMVIVAATLGMAIWLAGSGRLTAVQAGAATLAVALVAHRLSAIADATAELHEGALFLDDYRSFVAAPERPRPRARPPGRLDGIGVHAVHFTYPGGDEPAVRGVDLELRRGEVVAIVGENGSGKTTLAKLVTGLYRPQRGSITWNGTDLRELDPNELLAEVSMQFQHSVRLRLPVFDNIAAFDPAAAEAVVLAAAERAGIAQVIRRLPAGLATQLGPEFLGGTELSGGQWQRLALARTYYRHRGLVVFDEPTAALDPLAERAFFASLRNAVRGCAALVISHRLDYVAAADHIYVMRGGAIVDHGTHETLSARSRPYTELLTGGATDVVS